MAEPTPCARTAASIRGCCRSRSSALVLRPKPSRIAVFASLSESPSARKTWLGLPDPLAQADPAENARVRQSDIRRATSRPARRILRLPCQARVGVAVQGPVGEERAGGFATGFPHAVRRIPADLYRARRRAEPGAERGRKRARTQALLLPPAVLMGRMVIHRARHSAPMPLGP